MNLEIGGLLSFLFMTSGQPKLHVVFYMKLLALLAFILEVAPTACSRRVSSTTKFKIILMWANF